jgi:hypothetical protein
METEKQVCTADQGRKLKELGITANSLFWWVDRGQHSKLVYAGQIEFGDMLPLCPAYTVAELGLLLPAFRKNDYDLKCSKDSMWDGWDIEYSYPKIGGGKACFEDMQVYGDTQAEACALMLIWLLENGHATKEEIAAEYAKVD